MASPVNRRLRGGERVGVGVGVVVLKERTFGELSGGEVREK